MLFKQIYVDGFGIWNKLPLNDLDPGLNVFLAPNGGGKSTLMDFFRAILFGFKLRGDPRRRDPLRGGGHGGFIDLLVDNEQLRVHRNAGDTSKGIVRLEGVDGKEFPASRLNKLLHQTSETLYENIFAFGLEELQRLETLQHEDIAGHIYGAGVGSGTVNPVSFDTELKKNMGQIYLKRGKNQPVAKLLAQIESEQSQIEALRQDHAKHAEEIQKQQCLRKRLQDRNRMLETHRNQLDNLKRAQRAWPYYKQLLACEEAFAACLSGEVEENTCRGGDRPKDAELERDCGKRMVPTSDPTELMSDTQRRLLGNAPRIHQLTGDVERLKRLRSAVLELREEASTAEKSFSAADTNLVSEAISKRSEKFSHGTVAIFGLIIVAIILLLIVLKPGVVTGVSMGLVGALVGLLVRWLAACGARLRRLNRAATKARSAADASAVELGQVCIDLRNQPIAIEWPARDPKHDSLNMAEQLLNEIENRQVALAEAEHERNRLKELKDQYAKPQAALRALSGEEGLDAFRKRLKSWDPKSLARSIDDTEGQVAEAQAACKVISEKVGASGQRINQLEHDRQLGNRLQTREDHRATLELHLEDWASMALSAALSDEAKRRHEEERQPELFQLAGEYLAKMTEGRFQRVIARLGESSVLVECGLNHERLPPETLSDGEKGQLYLAMRLALAKIYAKHVVALPIVADDILVTFDDDRARATARLLGDFADDGHQILVFTCHRHRAETFQRQVPSAKISDLPAHS